MHDVVSDVLTSPKVPKNRKRGEILKAASRYRDNTSFAMTRPEWLEMSRMMGANNMGGTAVDFLAGLPTPTVERGAVHMAGMNHGATGGMAAGGSMAGMDHSKMNMPASGAKASGAKAGDMAGMDHSKMNMTGGNVAMDPMMKLHMEMMADPVIMKRVMADPEMRAMMNSAMMGMPADHRAMMQKMMSRSSSAAAATHSHSAKKATVKKSSGARGTSAKPAVRTNVKAKPAAKKPAPKKPAPKKPAPKKDPMAGMDHSKMKM